MTARKITIILGLLAFCVTLFFLPVTMTLHGMSFDGFRHFWEIGHNDTVRFGVLGTWWGAIALLTTGVASICKGDNH